VTATTVTAVYR